MNREKMEGPGPVEEDRIVESRIRNDAELLKHGANIEGGVLRPTERQTKIMHGKMEREENSKLKKEERETEIASLGELVEEDWNIIWSKSKELRLSQWKANILRVFQEGSTELSVSEFNGRSYRLFKQEYFLNLNRAFEKAGLPYRFLMFGRPVQEGNLGEEPWIKFGKS